MREAEKESHRPTGKGGENRERERENEIKRDTQG